MENADPTQDSPQPTRKTGVIGKAIRISGNLRGREDLIVEGRVEGTISLEENHLVIEHSALIRADAKVENITVKGEMYGNSLASDKVEISARAKVMGDIKAPRVVMLEGAKFKGSIEMDVPLPEGLEVDAADTATAPTAAEKRSVATTPRNGAGPSTPTRDATQSKSQTAPTRDISTTERGA